MTEDNGPVPLYYHQDYESQLQTPGHPESPERVRRIMSFIKKSGIPFDLRSPGHAVEEDLDLVHGKKHIEKVRDFGVGFMDPDTFHTEKTYELSLRAAGGVISAVKASYQEKRPTFAFPRPPGHHAGPVYNMGFCYFNNPAIATRVAMRDIEELDRIAIVDIDGHHGNGTNDTFIDDPNVLYISSHHWGIFPGTGHHNDVGIGKGEGYNVNIPLNGGTGDPTYERVLEDLILPVLGSFKPQMIICSLGVDSHLMDPLTGLTLSSTGFLDLINGLLEFSRKKVDSRICFELEGGYHEDALAEVVGAAMDLCNPEPNGVRFRYEDTRETGPDTLRLKEIKDVHASFWKI